MRSGISDFRAGPSKVLKVALAAALSRRKGFDPKRVLRLVGEGMKNESKSVNSHMYAGDAFRNLGETQRALEHYKTGLKLDPASSAIKARIQQLGG